MIVDSFRTFLVAQTGVASLCPQMFPLTIPASAKPPAITFSVDSDERDQLLDDSGSLRRALIECSSWHTDHYMSHQIADAIESALVGHRGAFGSVTAEHIRLERRLEIFESDTGLYRVSQQFLIAYHS